MTTASQPIPNVQALLGDAVAQEVLGWIGAFRALTTAFIISFNMQDYDFWGQGRLSYLLIRQLAYGAQVVVMTTPPPGKPSTQGFLNKLILLEDLSRQGIDVYLHPDLHAKVYIFEDSRNSKMTIVGSPNLTNRGFGTRGAASDDLLELALVSSDPAVHSNVISVVQRHLIGNLTTETFSTWLSRHVAEVAIAKGGR